MKKSRSEGSKIFLIIKGNNFFSVVVNSDGFIERGSKTAWSSEVLKTEYIHEEAPLPNNLSYPMSSGFTYYTENICFVLFTAFLIIALVNLIVNHTKSRPSNTFELCRHLKFSCCLDLLQIISIIRQIYYGINPQDWCTNTEEHRIPLKKISERLSMKTEV